MSPELTLSVVICAYTPARAERLRAAVGSVLGQADRPEEVIVVVDHSPELERWARAALPGTRVVASPGPRGLAGARNAGVAQARGDVVAFLDDDATAAPGWVAGLRAAHADPAVVCAGGAVEPAWPHGRPRWMPEEFDWVVGCTYRGMPVRRARVRNVIGANMSVRRDAVLRVGGFDPALGRTRERPLGCEETDLCLRLTAAEPGGAILFEPALGVRHHVDAGRTSPRYFAARCWAEGRSKAAVVQRSGARRGLASERAHARRALPAGVARALRAGNPARALAIVAGLGLAASGYIHGRLRP